MIYTIQYKDGNGEYQLYSSLLDTNLSKVKVEIENALALSAVTVLYGKGYVLVTIFDHDGNEMMCDISDNINALYQSLGFRL